MGKHQIAGLSPPLLGAADGPVEPAAAAAVTACGSWAAALPATKHALPVSSGRARTPDLRSSVLPMPAMSIATLLQAAEYLDRRERGELPSLGRPERTFWL